jgi:hypothetical protein
VSTEVIDRNAAISSAVSTEVIDRNAAISSAVSTEVIDRNAAISSAVSAETSARETALILQDFATDTAAATGGIALYALYRTGDVIKMRLT